MPACKAPPDSLTNPCNLCGATAFSVLARRGRDGNALRTVICSNCGLVWSDPFPHETRQFYSEDYRLEYKGSFEPKPRHVIRAAQVAIERLRKVSWLFAQPKKVLDVGSGGGEFAYLLSTHGHEVKGIEPNRGYSEYSRREYGLDVINGFVQDADLQAGSFDVVTIWHVLEHTPDPTGVLQRLHHWLRPDGMLVVEVPNVEATCHAPGSSFHDAHLFNFSVATLTGMLSRAGFAQEECALTADGGNITLIARRVMLADASIEQCVAHCNPQRTLEMVRNRSAFAHYRSMTPYLRLFQRLGRGLRERLVVRGFDGARAYLDRFYASRR